MARAHPNDIGGAYREAFGQYQVVMAWKIKPLTRLVSAEGIDSVPQAYLENLI